ncbi:hypothetical protein ACFX11_003066 [Malus domestica]
MVLRRTRKETRPTSPIPNFHSNPFVLRLFFCGAVTMAKLWVAAPPKYPTNLQRNLAIAFNHPEGKQTISMEFYRIFVKEEQKLRKEKGAILCLLLLCKSLLSVDNTAKIGVSMATYCRRTVHREADQ